MLQPLKKTLFVSLVLGAVGTLTFAPGTARAAFIQNTTGITTPALTITFSEVKPSDGTAVTNQYSSYGVSFTNLYYDTSGSNAYNGRPNFNGDYLTNNPIGAGPRNPFTILFSQNQSSAAFALTTASSNTATFSSYLDGALVETVTAPTATNLPNDFYGFTNSNFNEIRINSGTFAYLDNLQLSNAVAAPEPSTYAMMALGCLTLGWGHQRRKTRQESDSEI